jgi:putative flavoprotein involved in K+ transport
MSRSGLDVVVVGEGHGGLAVSCCLQRHGLRHIVLERGKIGESWRTQRWDSFALNSPNRVNVLPGDTYEGSNPNGFDSAREFVSYLGRYASKAQLPVHENAPVISVERDSSGFNVKASVHGTTTSYRCRQLVVASGAMSGKKTPPFAGNMPSRVRQFHASEYRNPSQLPDGPVLVVGSGQSGLQVAEDFIAANQLDAPPPEPDPADEPDTNAACACSITSLDLEKSGIRSIVWTTGFSADYSYLKFPVLCGIDEDAKAITGTIKRTAHA